MATNQQQPFDNRMAMYEAQQQRLRGSLTVSDIERLAKAGVKVELASIDLAQVLSDPPLEPGHRQFTPLQNAFWDRWKRANWRYFENGHRTPYYVAAAEHGDKVYVFVASEGVDIGSPVIIEDEKHLYPSDRLMAAVALLAQVGKKQP